jgi:hypothetical protein
LCGFNIWWWLLGAVIRGVIFNYHAFRNWAPFIKYDIARLKEATSGTVDKAVSFLVASITKKYAD